MHSSALNGRFAAQRRANGKVRTKKVRTSVNGRTEFYRVPSVTKSPKTRVLKKGPELPVPEWESSAVNGRIG